jgi:hypothetical protein
MTGALDQRGLAAASTVAAAHGLSVDEAVVIHSASNVLVHMRPAPVVARVMTGTVALHSDPQRWLKREVSVLEFLDPTGVAVSPSRLIAPGPHSCDGLWMTFTEWVAEVQPATDLGDARGLGRRLRNLHDELRRFDGELGDLDEMRERIERLLVQLRPVDAQEAAVISSLGTRLNEFRTVVFESDLPTQPLHGDVSLRNLLRTPHRQLWNDFEDTFRGPVHWDVASFVGSLRGHEASPDFVREMLDGYGWGDEDELASFLAAQDVYDEIWRMFDRQRRRS